LVFACETPCCHRGLLPLLVTGDGQQSCLPHPPVPEADYRLDQVRTSRRRGIHRAGAGSSSGWRAGSAGALVGTRAGSAGISMGSTTIRRDGPGRFPWHLCGIANTLIFPPLSVGHACHVKAPGTGQHAGDGRSLGEKGNDAATGSWRTPT